MSKVVLLENYGGPEVLKFSNIKLPDLGAEQVLISNKAIGLNNCDIEHRKGIYNVPSTPCVLGVEAVGIIDKVGPRVVNFNVGDRVACCTAPNGAYCEQRVINQKYLVKVPNDISDEIAVSCLFKAMNAHYLLYRVNPPLKKGTFVVIHNVVDGIGYILSQWARVTGYKVIGTVANSADFDFAKNNGCSYVYNYTNPDFVEEIMSLTNRLGVSMVLDSVGLDTAKISLEVLAMFGFYIIYGQSSGMTPPVAPILLSRKSLILTHTYMFHYKNLHFDIAMTAMEIFSLMKKKLLHPVIGSRYSFDQIKQAHIDMESGNIKGSAVVLL